ncbi:MAG: hypothetical protein IJZ56_05500 [Oscillospiraceae bacterium]|nr:hypothetical protein [Oscillospiraceae bacterium]
MKKLLAILLALTILLSFAACTAANEDDKGQTTAATTETTEGTEGTDGTEDPNQPTGTGSKTFTVVVVHKDQSTKEYVYKTDEEFVGKVLQDHGLIQGNMGQYGLEITVVDGEKAVYAEDAAYWAIYEGEEYAMQGIDTTPVVDGRTYKLVYTGA